MGKIHVDHKVVILDSDGNEILSKSFPHHAEALPEFERRCTNKANNCVVRLQHGARILRKG